MPPRLSVPALGKGVVAIAYVAVVFWACIQREPRWWSLLPLLAPVALWLGVVAGKRLGKVWQAVLALAFLAALASMLAWLVPAGHDGLIRPQQVRLYYFLQETLLLGLVFLAFAHTLRAGHTPLCTAMAGMVHPALSPAQLRYTRAVTWMWVIVIALLWLVSAALFLWAQPAAWAFFSSVVSPVLTLAVFILEVLARRWFLPPAEATGMRDTLRAMRSVDWRAFSGVLQQKPAEPRP